MQKVAFEYQIAELKQQNIKVYKQSAYIKVRREQNVTCLTVNKTMKISIYYNNFAQTFGNGGKRKF